ncbi:UDP-N-acetylmuramoyl-tripeptide--D-alanyl-D-alanine ligase [Thermoanaerobacterium sp. DL9XJH110]|uniref:UDP-N-acetylmuramoyl-tripeptide--D-alanyl-D- alanine ligase n=1 Tax=Thermoanaerobacterium sp. DL9XJH110 TaxID=3386643 RepID=UPI003BB6A3E1
MRVFIYALPAAVFFAAIFLETKWQLHMVQLEGYKPKQYLGWIRHNIKSLFIDRIWVPVLSLILFPAATWGRAPAGSLISFAIWSLAILYGEFRRLKPNKKAKKPLVFTHRATRLFVFAVAWQMSLGYLGFVYRSGAAGFLLTLSAIIFLVPVDMLLSTAVLYPVEMLIQLGYFRSAQNKIKGMKNLKVIGITGSYGKTSTKHFIATILSEKYNTLMTPESYNTPMGVTRVIREQLNETHQIFVCEMGARNRGDIKTLCRLAKPSIGVLTAIGPQHLETFKTLDNVAGTKFELIESLPPGGLAIMNGDNEHCRKLAGRSKVETLLYGFETPDKDFYIRAEDVKNSREGLSFKVRVKGGPEFDCSARLLGRHNVSNLLAAIAVALRLGLSVEQIREGLRKIKPVPHRLQILDTGNGVTVIDDAFNSNPVGAREALECVKEMEGGKRIVVTPGMVELGEVEYEENKKLGRIMAACCDYAILVGRKRSKPILEGLEEGNFPRDRIRVVAGLEEATAVLSQIVRPGDVVLFENDLPDNYDE